MDVPLHPLLDILSSHGPWLLFLMAVAETCFVTGLMVPSGVATSAATILALQGHLSLPAVLFAALAGGAVGDSIGFWVGRTGGVRLTQGGGWVARVVRRQRGGTEPFFRKSPLFSVTLARLVSFVRTLMPMTAGMSPLPYRTFLAFELVGVSAWVAMYMAIGLAARESWQAVTSVVGAGWTVAFLLVGLVLWFRARRLVVPAGFLYTEGAEGMDPADAEGAEWTGDPVEPDAC